MNIRGYHPFSPLHFKLKFHIFFCPMLQEQLLQYKGNVIKKFHNASKMQMLTYLYLLQKISFKFKRFERQMIKKHLKSLVDSFLHFKVFSVSTKQNLTYIPAQRHGNPYILDTEWWNTVSSFTIEAVNIESFEHYLVLTQYYLEFVISNESIHNKFLGHCFIILQQFIHSQIC